MKVSVLIPYFQGRRALLERTLWLLERQTYDDYDVWILDDGSDENIAELCCGPRIIYEKVRDAGAHPRASNMAWIHGYERCQGGFVILTHPEYMPPINAIEEIVKRYDGSARLGTTAYALPPRVQAVIDTVDWKTNLNLFQQMPDFWTFRNPWGWSNMTAHSWHHHFAFTGQTRMGWDLFDFVPLTEKRGVNDSWLVEVEIKAERYPKYAGFSVYHQHHERTTQWPFPEKSARIKRIAENN